LHKKQVPINCEELVSINNPHVQRIDKLSPLSADNGKFAFAVDANGLQTLPEVYKTGIPT